MSAFGEVRPERESGEIGLRRPRAPLERACRLFTVASCVLLGPGGCVPSSSDLTDTLPTTGEGTVLSDPSTTTTGASSLPTTDTDALSGSTTSSSESSTSQSTTIGSSGPCEAPIGGLVTSHAYYEFQAPPDMTGSGSSTNSTGRDVDPDTLYITLSDASITCEDPDASLDCGPRWSVSIVLPPEFQSPGLYPVGTDDVLSLFVETGVDEGGGICSFGAGSWEATLEVISIGDGVVEGRLCDVDTGLLTLMPTLDGLFTAELCP